MAPKQKQNKIKPSLEDPIFTSQSKRLFPAAARSCGPLASPASPPIDHRSNPAPSHHHAFPEQPGGQRPLKATCPGSSLADPATPLYDSPFSKTDLLDQASSEKKRH